MNEDANTVNVHDLAIQSWREQHVRDHRRLNEAARIIHEAEFLIGDLTWRTKAQEWLIDAGVSSDWFEKGRQLSGHDE